MAPKERKGENMMEMGQRSSIPSTSLALKAPDRQKPVARGQNSVSD
jgi:hypothetical protein